jgi:simple sugar transport system permease protein
VRNVAVALLWAMLVASVLILFYGESPLAVYQLMLERTWGDRYGLGQVFFRATPLVFTGLAVGVAFRGGMFNIGGEGQLIAGSFFAAVAGALLPPALPAPVAVTACLAAAALGGGLTGALPGWLRARFGAHEVISTIMLNFIVAALALGAGRRGLFQPETVHTAPIVDAARLPPLAAIFGDGTAASGAFVIALAAGVAAEIWSRRSRRAFELRALGLNPLAAEAGGVPVAATTIWVMTLSGALAGLAAAGTVLGYKGYFEEGLGSGAGFMGIAVALLGRAQPIAVIPSALLFATLAQGGLAANAVVPKEIIEVIQAVIILAIAWRAGK